jgi:ParB family chromosome partitioning protein
MESDSKTSAELAIIENLHRRDLSVFEEAGAIASLIEIYHLTQEQIAKKLGITQAAVANKLRLLRLSEEEKELISKHNLTERHARALLKIKNDSDRIKILHKIIDKELNVKQTEDYIEEKLSTKEKEEKTETKDSKSLVRLIERAIEKTRICGTKIKTQSLETPTEITLTITITK